ncbi:MAG: ribonucleoside-diphosphate reductase subunit alpha [Opitutales bacterium]|jgi:ribonucleoside-diphosphate reductase alpha chain|nr:ribonucleoside-diphosphate reductase subunit alpha [Opitutales bacterium]MDP4658262.1 ribonucleoside-diphosphate reductase subunit alpha [Opitutales bacterium]MDP4775597.1 ribonucleoside-diphosphate reductase subunit alpha [Opitutales bacterium]MDP4788306.1 ribonucleoside-diphosphate reductase subunit alpha [Opitutales bacterium]MDP4860522.1 ribonucleoside-diphosphate reductase subunit alpha [Opitutales bacterium]
MKSELPFFREDIALKHAVRAPADAKPRFNWRESLPAASAPASAGLDAAQIADIVGAALTDLLVARQEQDIFTESNRQFVAAVASDVVRVLSQSGVQVSEILVLQAIEDALVRYNRHDVAKSLLFSRGGEVAPVDPLAITTRLMRRNGQVVPWLPNKITTAVRMAFLSLEQDPAPAVRVTAAVTRRVADLGQTIIGIEEVQDLVQEELMRQGHFKVAQNYILYRAYRARRREELAAQPVVVDDRQESMILVKSADGSTYLWNGDELRKRIAFAAAGLELVRTPDQIESELRRGLFNEISEADLRKTIELNAKSLVEVDADFAKFAARICLSYIYEEVLGWSITRDGVSQLKEFHRAKFAAYVERGIAIGRLSPDLRKYDLAKLAAALDPMADLDFELLGVQTMYDRYLIIDKTVKPARRLETPQFFWMRVAMGLFLREEKNREDWVIRLHALYKSRRFCSSTPTLFNSGTLHSQLSSCYLYQVNDTIESIMIRGIAENAFLSKWAGGLGGSWTSVRGTGSYIKGTNGESQGIIPFLKLHNDQLVAVNQGGKRRGSGCAYLETWHNDIEDFLELRKNTGDDRRRTHDMNTANWIPDLFMKRLKNRQGWTLFLSNETPDLHETFGADFEKRYVAYEERAKKGEIFGKEIPALELWKKMLGMIFETGHPWITFKDPCNVRSPQDHVGVIHSSNLCTEITLNTSAEETAVCNLGSVVLDSHLKADGGIDHAMLRETVTVAVRALDNVIDINFYPTKAAEVSNLRHRPVGMGVMGLQDCLYRRDISFASDAAVEFNDEIMEAVAYYAYETSADLAAERGTYSTYKGSKWDRGLLPQDTVDLLEQERGEPIEVKRGGRMDWAPVRAKIAKSGMRNSNVLAIAPTATISNIVGSSPCIEPTYKNLFVKSNLSGEFTELNGYLVRDLKKLGLWNQEMMQQIKYFDGELKDIAEIPQAIKDKYLTAFTIENKWLIDAAARRQKWIDQAQSLNLFLPTPDLKMLSHMYQYAWRTGLKTTYYLRTLGASNIEKATVEKAPKAEKKEYTAEEKNACSIEAMRNGGTCEACQ